MKGATPEKHNRSWSWSMREKKPENSEDVPYPLTKGEALIFIKTKLRIPDPLAQFEEDRLKFLHHLLERFKKNIPYTNLHTFLSTPLPEMDEYVPREHMLSGEGGTCYWINPFIKALLERLGYRVHHICGYSNGDLLQDTHLGILVEDAAYPGSTHLVEVGTRRPLNAAIPLDFERESPEYQFHYMTSKFFREGDRLIWGIRTSTLKLDGEYIMYDSKGKAWKADMIYHLKEKRNWYPFLGISRQLYALTKDNLVPPFNGLVFWAYLNEEQYVSVFAYQNDISINLYGQDGSVKNMNLSKLALLNFFQENFPQYSDARLQDLFQVGPFY